jgi:thioredoxin-like negative regulator of GroEL
MGDQALVAKVDIDEFFELADRLGIRGLPALVVYRQGGVVHHLAGLRSKEQIMELLK